MAGTHSYWLILLSVIVATMASFVGLDLGGRLERFRHHGMRSLWLVAGALSIGMGIWTMHFIGMLGFHLPIAVSYDIWITLLSLSVSASHLSVPTATMTLPLTVVPLLDTTVRGGLPGASLLAPGLGFTAQAISMAA